MTVSPLDFDLDSYQDKSYATHGFHPYPAKFVPQIPQELIRRYSTPGQTVMDPFCGSGTTLVESLLMGRKCFGADVNELAVLISQTKTTPLDAKQLETIRRVTISVRERYTSGHISAEPAPAIANLSKWFSDAMQRELSLIKEAIDLCGDVSCARLLKVAFAYAVGKASNQESDTVYRAVERRPEEGTAVAAFAERVSQMASRLEDWSPRLKGDHCRVQKLDITRERFDPELVADIVVTSPPYMNSYDYYLYHKHRLAWLGIDHAPIQRDEFGSRNKHNDQGLGVEAYVDAVDRHLEVISPNLRPGAVYACVVGDGIVRGEVYRADVLFDKIFAGRGYSRLDSFTFNQRKYTRSFTPNLKKVPKLTHVLVYQA